MSKLSSLQRINIHCRIMSSGANLGFVAEVVWSAMNLKFATNIELFAAN